jgi:16S rRNA (guanine527-N7)-methyltransferase
MTSALDESGFGDYLRWAGPLSHYLERVLDANRRFNLTAVREFDEAIWLHVIDSLLGLRLVQAAPAGSLADLGSGAGFPGVPLLMCSGRNGVLVESVGKKASFMREATEWLRIEGRVLGCRAEEMAVGEPASQAVVTARALASLPSLVELASPLLQVGGLFIAYKGTPSEDEIERGRKASSKVGMRQTDIVRLTLHGPRPAERALVVFEKIGPGAIPLPRRIGSAQKEPLA